MAAIDSTRAARWIRTLNLVLQGVLFLTFCLGLNYLAQNHPWRKDLTQNHRYSLTAESKFFLKNLDRPVRVIVTLVEEPDKPLVTPALAEIRGLLREYTFAAAGNVDPKTNRDGRISVEYLDVWQQRNEAGQLGIDRKDVVVFICGNKQRVVTVNEIFEIKVSEGQARIESFRGEDVFTSAIVDVSNVERKKIYFLNGEGELRIDSTDPVKGISAFATELLQRNYAVESLDLTPPAAKVPEDAALVIAAGPQGVDPGVQEKLRLYLDRPGALSGRMILMLWQDKPHRLDELLYDWGVKVDTDLICDDDPSSVTDSGDFNLRMFAQHPVTQSLGDQNLPLRIGLARSLYPEPGRANTGNLKVTTLAATSKSAWGETSTNPVRVEYNPGIDIKGLKNLSPPDRLGVIAAAERVAPDGLAFNLKLGRLIVIGTTDIATNRRMDIPGNLSFMLNAVNWSVGRESQLNLPARPVERYQLSLSQQELIRLRFSLLFLLPGAAAFLGLIVYWTRRS